MIATAILFIVGLGFVIYGVIAYYRKRKTGPDSLNEQYVPYEYNLPIPKRKKSPVEIIIIGIALCLPLLISVPGMIVDEIKKDSYTVEIRRKSGWPFPNNVDNLVGVFKYNLDLEDVQKMGWPAITDIADCEAVMEFYDDGNGRIALYGEKFKSPNPRSEAYDLEWYAEKVDPKDIDIDIPQGFSDFYLVRVAFYKVVDIGFKGEYIFMQNADKNAEEWLILSNDDSKLILPTIKLKTKTESDEIGSRFTLSTFATPISSLGGHEWRST